MRIKVENLSKRFNREWIFKNLNYEFLPAHTYAIVGPNGCGKSTLLQVLWGQMVPTSGKIEYLNINGDIPVDQTEVFKHISIATPYMELIDEFTLVEMVNFHFKFKKLQTGIQITEIPDLLELRHASDKLIMNFSSGMRQRLKLGLAFFSQSDFLFLDEPTTNLDRKATDWYWKHLTTAIEGRTVIIASNQPHEYPENCSKINIMDYKKGY